MRPLVSYDDIASQASEQETRPESFSSAVEPGPTRKRRRNNRQGQRFQNKDDDNDRHPPKKSRRDYGLKEESRQLTHEEVWDDSALIHAWDAAVEEYEVLNGPDKKWKSEPVSKSALWFNIPPVEEPSMSQGPSFLVPIIPTEYTTQNEQQKDQDLEPPEPENSQPIHFNTFVPRHDPALPHSQGFKNQDLQGVSSARASYYPSIDFPPTPPGVSGPLTKDHALQQAIGAWYWAGYWTGIYHSTSGSTAPGEAEADEEYEDEPEETGVAAESVEREQGQDIVVDASIDETRLDEEDLVPT